MRRLTAEEQLRMQAGLEMAPTEYRVLLDNSEWRLCGQYTAEHHAFREVLLKEAMKRGLNSGALGAILLELSAALFVSGMKRETFLKNAELWYDSAEHAASDGVSNSPGTKGTPS